MTDLHDLIDQRDQDIEALIEELMSLKDEIDALKGQHQQDRAEIEQLIKLNQDQEEVHVIEIDDLKATIAKLTSALEETEKLIINNPVYSSQMAQAIFKEIKKRAALKSEGM